MLWVRVVTGLIGAPILVGLIWLGYWPFAVAVIALSLVALLEFYAPWPRKNIYPVAWLGVLFGLTFPVMVAAGSRQVIMVFMAALVASVLIWQIFTARRARAGIDAGVTVLGSLYAGLFPSFLILTYSLPNGRHIILAAVVAVWACDMAAFFLGKAFGRHKLAPEISPGKTIEGAAAGAIAALIAGVFFASIGWLTWPKGIFLGITVALLAQLGDLVASMLKREVGIKDFGRILPGHGGVLDRFDGLFFAAPFIYFLFYLY
jgi:phosphatidate cytidylyltransferase